MWRDRPQCKPVPEIWLNDRQAKGPPTIALLRIGRTIIDCEPIILPTANDRSQCGTRSVVVFSTSMVNKKEEEEKQQLYGRVLFGRKFLFVAAPSGGITLNDEIG